MFSNEEIKSIKDKYKNGTKIELIDMNDSMAVPSGTKGVVDYVDDVGTIHMKWDNGSSLGLVVGEDDFKIINKENTKVENSEISEEDYISYLELQKLGAVNMLDYVYGCKYTGLNKQTYFAIIEKYSKLKEQYPGAYEKIFKRNISI